MTLRKPAMACKHCLLGNTDSLAKLVEARKTEGIMKFTDAQIGEHLQRIPGWSRDGNQIVRELKFENFKSAMSFVNRVAEAAEAMDHHPDILIHGWNNVRLSLMTHSHGGLTEKDFTLAGQINQLD